MNSICGIDVTCNARKGASPSDLSNSIGRREKNAFSIQCFVSDLSELIRGRKNMTNAVMTYLDFQAILAGLREW